MTNNDAQPTDHTDDIHTRLDTIESQCDEMTRLLDTLHVNVAALFSQLSATPPSASRRQRDSAPVASR